MKDPIPITGALLRRWPLAEPQPDGDKSTRGSVAAIGGSIHMPGAILLTAEACLRSGAGRVQIFTDRAVVPLIGSQMPEAWVGAWEPAKPDHPLLKECQALVIGPGLATPAYGQRVVEALLPHLRGRPAVLDAHALIAARQAARASARSLVITPNPGEMARLIGWTKTEVQAQPAVAAQRVARELAVVVMLKGADTWVATPEGDVWINVAGTISLGTAGSGDVLAGIIAGLLAQGVEAPQAAVWATALHTGCGARLTRHLGGIGFLARELLPAIPRLRAQFRRR